MLEEVAKLLTKDAKAIALTGAGVSIASGIPDFRSAQGLWAKFPPEEYATISAFRLNPAKVWKMMEEMDKVLNRARPNPAHKVLAGFEADGILGGVITQNIDGLHQLAGSKNVVEFHGSYLTLTCPSCFTSYRREDVLATIPPTCTCGSILKPDVVLFGEEIPAQAYHKASTMALTCKVMIVAGTSAVVSPASLMPSLAKKNRAVIVEINNEATGLTRSVTDYFLEGKAEEILPKLAGYIKSSGR